MTFFEAILLGIIQGLTEFLPISSSGHLVLFQSWLNISIEGNTFEVIVHIGTLGSILFVFWEDVYTILKNLTKRESQFQVGTLALATIPAVLVGFTLKDYFEILFDNTTSVSIALMVTGVILFISKFAKQNNSSITWKSGLLIGLAQAIAIIPGISRSGFTISAALLLGKNSREAARFSFLLAIPVITGAGLLTAMDGLNGESFPIPILLGGLLSSFIIGVFALQWLIQWLESGKYYWFGAYCMVIGLTTWIF